MSLHSAAKRLAVLEAVLEQKLSIREAAKLHGVAKESVSTWLRAQHRGEETLEMYRDLGYQATSPVVELLSAVMPRRREKFAATRGLSVADISVWRARGIAMRKELEQRREVLAEQLAEIDKALVELPKDEVR